MSKIKYKCDSRIPIRKTVVFLLVFLSIFLSNCSSLHKNAEEHLLREEYIEASNIFQDILAEEPGDTKAQAGLRKANKGIISKKLIDARLIRLAGNNYESLDILRKVIEFENSNNIFPGGVVFSTQLEEQREGFKFLKKEVNQYIKDNKPTPARLMYEKYAIIFNSGSTLKEYKNIISKVVRVGRKKCNYFLKKTKRKLSYYNEFSSKYCSYWGSNQVKNRSVASKDSESAELFKNVSVKYGVNKLPTILNKLLSKRINEGLRNSAWYSPNANKFLKLQLTGGFINNYKERPVLLKHEYFVKIPYTAYMPILKTKQVPYATTKNVYDYQSGLYYSVPATAYRTEYYTIQQPYTAYKKQPRSTAYQGFEYSQNLALALIGNSTIKGQKFNFNIESQDTLNGTYHNESMPNIGLDPVQKEIEEPLEWFKLKTEGLSLQITTKLNDYWRKLNCKSNLKLASINESGEHIHKCNKGFDKNESQDQYNLVENWYSNNLGITYEESLNIF
jgi:hypothetical protein